jgi:hypothetical protein
MDNPDHLDNSDSDAEEANENNNAGLSAGQDEYDAADDFSISDENTEQTRTKTSPPNSGNSRTTLGHCRPSYNPGLANKQKRRVIASWREQKQSRPLLKNSINPENNYRSDCSKERKKRIRKSSGTNWGMKNKIKSRKKRKIHPTRPHLRKW